MSLFVDTSVWSMLLRRDVESPAPEVSQLRRALENGESLCTTGLVLQELLQGFSGPKAKQQIVDRFSAIPLLLPVRDDHVAAAELRNACRRAGVQVGTIDALIASLCIRNGLLLLTLDLDFARIAKHSALRTWRARGG